MENEKRLISVDVVLTGIATFKECYNGVGLKPWVVEHILTALQMVERFVKESPTVDAVEVVHGRWIEKYVYDSDPHDRIRYKCSICGRIEEYKEPYCNCGAKMDGDGND